MTTRLIIDEHSVYEIDEECEKTMRNGEAAQKKKNAEDRQEKMRKRNFPIQ